MFMYDYVFTVYKMWIFNLYLSEWFSVSLCAKQITVAYTYILHTDPRVKCKHVSSFCYNFSVHCVHVLILALLGMCTFVMKTMHAVSTCKQLVKAMMCVCLHYVLLHMPEA